MRCDECRHWGKAQSPYLDEGEQLLGVRRCGKAVEIWEATEWNDECERVAKTGFADQLMFTMDGSSYMAQLLTRASFFCAHFDAALQESKETEG